MIGRAAARTAAANAPTAVAKELPLKTPSDRTGTSHSTTLFSRSANNASRAPASSFSYSRTLGATSAAMIRGISCWARDGSISPNWTARRSTSPRNARDASRVRSRLPPGSAARSAPCRGRRPRWRTARRRGGPRGTRAGTPHLSSPRGRTLGTRTPRARTAARESTRRRARAGPP